MPACQFRTVVTANRLRLASSHHDLLQHPRHPSARLPSPRNGADRVSWLAPFNSLTPLIPPRCFSGKVQCVLPSKWAGMCGNSQQGNGNTAALFRTDRGDFEVLFLPGRFVFDHVAAKEEKHGDY